MHRMADDSEGNVGVSKTTADREYAESLLQPHSQDNPVLPHNHSSYSTPPTELDFEEPPSPFIAFNEGDAPPLIPEAEKESGKLTLQVHASDYPRLRLSGRIISASFCLPHNLTYTNREEHPWVSQTVSHHD